MIDVIAINAFIIWQGMSHESGNLFIRGKKKSLISLGKELCQHTKEAVPPTLSTRKEHFCC